MSDETQVSPAAQGGAAMKYEADAIYQGSKLVARVLGADIDLAAKEIYFSEVNHSDELVLADECEFQKYRIMIQHIEYASRIDKNTPEKGRVLRRVVADILGYREQ